MAHADIERQMTDVRTRWSGASHAFLPSGTALVAVPGLPLPQGWTQPTTKVMFLLQPEFPVAQPDIYYLEEGVLPPNGTIRANHQRQRIPETQIDAVWISWHAQAWNPNRDTIMSWLGTIIRSFGALA